MHVSHMFVSWLKGWIQHTTFLAIIVALLWFLYSNYSKFAQMYLSADEGMDVFNTPEYEEMLETFKQRERFKMRKTAKNSRKMAN